MILKKSTIAAAAAGSISVLAWFMLASCVQPPLPVNYAAVDTLDIALRLGTATLVGAVVGLNRDLHGKPTGVRTLGLVCLGSALIVMATDGFAPTVSAHWDARSRT